MAKSDSFQIPKDWEGGVQRPPLPNEEDFEPDLRRAFEFAHQTINPELIDHSKVKMHKDKIKLSGDSVFYTLQGEGTTMGLPCVFVRLHVCNLRCTWCDAWYTWNPQTVEFWTESKDYSFARVADMIRNTWACKDPDVPKRVIFTGGEPLIQRKQIDEVMKLLPGWKAEFETNGTLMPTEWQLENAQFNVSPKLANSDNKRASMVKPKILDALNTANSTFKFVCYDEKDLEEIEEKYLPYISKHKVIIMAQGIRSDEIDMNLQKLYHPCMSRGYRLLGRLQAQFADGARRAV